MKRLFPIFLAAALVVPALLAAANDADIVSAWYEALLAVDRDQLSELLADDARIHLEDLGVEQSKAEFIAALDEWETAAQDAEIRHNVEGEENGMIAVAACYDFPDNELLVRELFRIDADKVVESIQSNLSEDCGDL